MIYSDGIRQFLLIAVGLTFTFFAAWAAIQPESLAKTIGYELTNNNAYSEFHAIYVGVFIAQALLCALAYVRIQDATLGDLVAIFLLAQPAARLIAGIRREFPTGLLRLLFIMEIIGGSMLLAVRPFA